MKLSDLAYLVHAAHKVNVVPGVKRSPAGANRGQSYSQGKAPLGPNSQKMLK
jgi:hypothetical protein